MNHERALLLAEALESGQYVQGYNVLERVSPDGQRATLCCLGVACRVAMANGLRLVVHHLDLKVVAFDGMETALPDSVREWFGFRDSGGSFGLNEGMAQTIEGYQSLMGMNDSEDFTFADIARVIRENWEVL